MKKIWLPALAAWLTGVCPAGAQAVKHILLEEFSTAQCGFCPDGDVIAQQLIANHPSVIWVTHHAGFGTDSMTVPESVPIAGAFTTFAPGGCIDRGDYPIPVYTIPPFIAVSRQKWDSIVTAHLNDPPVADIGIVNSYDSVSRVLDCTVDVHFVDTPAPGDLRLNLWLMEDSVVGFGPGYDQTNYMNNTPGHPYYQAGDPVVGYVHHHVLRHVESGAWGTAGILPAAPAAGSSYSHTYAGIAVPAGWKDDDITVVAFVSYYDPDPALRPVINAEAKALKDYSTTAVPEHSSPAAVDIFPNPAGDLVRITADRTLHDARVTLVSARGRTVLTRSFPGNRSGFGIRTGALAPGIYGCLLFEGDRLVHAGRLAVVR